MQKYYSFNDLALIAFNESDCEDNDESFKSFHKNLLLSKGYKKILYIKKYLADKNIGPSESTIRNILNYSQALSVNHTKQNGVFGIVLN
jgi:hypothetical protein